MSTLIAQRTLSLLAGPATVAVTLRRRVQAWREAHHTRRALGRLDAHMLKDIGLDPMTIEHEAARPFWDL